MTKKTHPRSTTLSSLLDEAWELARARKRSASRPLLDALEHAIRARDVDGVGRVRAAAGQMRYLSAELDQGAFVEAIELATRAQAELEAEGLRGTDPRRLDLRLESLLLLLRRSPDGAVQAHEALMAFVIADRNGDEAFDLQGPYLQWRHLLDRAYDRAYRMYGGLERVALGPAQPQIERQVKSVAVELITAGAQVRGLAIDAVPLIAFCLLHREIPIGMDTAGFAGLTGSDERRGDRDRGRYRSDAGSLARRVHRPVPSVRAARRCAAVRGGALPDDTRDELLSPVCDGRRSGGVWLA